MFLDGKLLQQLPGKSRGITIGALILGFRDASGCMLCANEPSTKIKTLARNYLNGVNNEYTFIPFELGDFVNEDLVDLQASVKTAAPKDVDHFLSETLTGRFVYSSIYPDNGKWQVLQIKLKGKKRTISIPPKYRKYHRGSKGRVPERSSSPLGKREEAMNRRTRINLGKPWQG